MWSKELHLHSRGWSRGPDWGWVQSSTVGDGVVGLSVSALWMSEELLYLCEQPLHLFVQHSSVPFGTVQLWATFEEWEVSVSSLKGMYLERSSCTSGQWKVSDSVLCAPVTVLCELAPELGVWTGLGERSSWMTSWSQVFKANLRLGLPAYIQKNPDKHTENDFQFSPYLS